MNELTTAFKTELGMRLSLDQWDEGGAYLHINHRHGSLGIPLTREEAQQLLANLQEALEA